MVPNELTEKIVRSYNLGKDGEAAFYQLVYELEKSIETGHQTMHYISGLVRQLDTKHIVVLAFIDYLTHAYMQAVSQVQN